MNRNAASMACMMCANGEIWRLDRVNAAGEVVRSTYAYVNDTGNFATKNGGASVAVDGSTQALGRAWDVSPKVANDLGFNGVAGVVQVVGTPIAITDELGLATSVVSNLNRGMTFSQAYAAAGGAQRGTFAGLTQGAVSR